MNIPDREEFLQGCEEFEEREKRDAMYKVATFLVKHFWGKPSEMADGLGVLFLTWNQAFYRYGGFNFDELERTISENMSIIESFRTRNIFELSVADEETIKDIFQKLLESLKSVASENKKEKKSPVSVAKALHLLAPDFFPLWDDKIARKYNCYYNKCPAEKYVLFCKKIKAFAESAKSFTDRTDKTLIKLIDQYNYSKFTQHWI